MANWDRQYRLRAGIEGGKGFEIGEPDKVSHLAVHISFTIEKSDSTTLNTTKIKLWNLNKEQISILTQTGCQIDITAGYGTSRPVVFRGTVANVNESLDGADRLVEIEAVDGFAELSETVISVSYSGKISKTQQINSICRLVILLRRRKYSNARTFQTGTVSSGMHNTYLMMYAARHRLCGRYKTVYCKSVGVARVFLPRYIS